MHPHRHLPAHRQTLLAATLVLMLAACGGSGGDTPSETSSPSGAHTSLQPGTSATTPQNPGTGHGAISTSGTQTPGGYQTDTWARYDNGVGLITADPAGAGLYGAGNRGNASSALQAGSGSLAANSTNSSSTPTAGVSGQAADTATVAALARPGQSAGSMASAGGSSGNADSSGTTLLTKPGSGHVLTVGNSSAAAGSTGGSVRPERQKDVPGSGHPIWTLGTRAEAARFLAQASFGPSPADITSLMQGSANAWIEQQFAQRPTSLENIMNTWAQQRGSSRGLQDLHDAWWFATIHPDQLRQRIAYSLSQIFVVSSSGDTSLYPQGVASYYDMLARNAFGNFRQLLQDVTLHPMMGVYLTHIGNQKERYNSAGELTQAPDENYAREVMQLFTIGLEELNTDGTPKKNAQGQSIPTYSNEDVMGLARVFTGLSWSGDARSHGCFFQTGACANGLKGADTRPMVTYDQYHSTLEKRFLGRTIPEGSSSTMGDITVALDTLFNHPNVGPFFGRQMIQRLVTSNPSPAYVQRVANAFNSNANGVRGDMQAVIRAVLLDPEARTAEPRTRPEWGRIREPLLRFTHLMRAFNAYSHTGYWPIGITQVPGNLNQTAMRAPSVFNFYRPGYSPSGTPIGNAGLVAPEMQILHESSVAGYADYLDRFVGATSPCLVGLANMIPDPGNAKCNNRKREIALDISPLLAKAGDIDALIDEIDTLMLNGQMRANTRRTIRDALETLQYNYRPTAGNIDNINRRRTSLALYMALLSTDYLVLK